MALAKKTSRKKLAPRRKRHAPSSKPAASTPWPTIECFLAGEEGNIHIGAINHSSLKYTAVASDEHTMLVALVRRDNETLHQLLDRLEQGLLPAIEDQIYIDEINGP